MRDYDQYVIMNFAMVEDCKQKVAVDRKKDGTKLTEIEKEQMTFLKEVNISIMF